MKNFLTIAILSISVLSGCSEDDAQPSSLERIEIVSSNGNKLDVLVNETSNLSLIGYDQKDKLFDIATTITWSAINGNIELDEDGTITAASVGTTVVTGSTDGFSKTIELEIWDSSIIERLLIISSGGSKLDIVENESVNLSVTGYNGENSQSDVTPLVTWSASNDHVMLDESGTATANSVGATTVTATLGVATSTLEINAWDSSAPRVEIYVSDVGASRNGPHQIIKYDEDGSNPETFINSGLSNPQDIIFIENQGIVLISNLSGNNIRRFDIETGDFIDSFATGLSGPTRMDIGPDGLLYVIQWNSGGVIRYDLDGSFVDIFTTPVFNAIGMDWDADGNLYVSSFNNGANGFVRKFDPQGVNQGNFISSNLIGPTDIWFDESGNLLVNDWSGNSVKKFDPDGAYLGVFISGVSQPEGVAFLDDGSILIGASGTGSIIKYDSNGTFIESLISGGGGLATPNAVVVRKVNFE